MSIKSRNKQSTKRSPPVLWKNRSASSSLTLLNIEALSLIKCASTPLHRSAPVTRPSSAAEIFPSRSPSKPLQSLKTRLKNYTLPSPSCDRSFSRSSTPTLSHSTTLMLHDTATSAEADFLKNLVRSGKQVSRFERRIPSVRTAVKKYESITLRQRLLASSSSIRNQIYDYVITDDSCVNDFSLSENCGAGYSDCSLGVISLDGYNFFGASFQDHIPILIQGRPYYTPSLSSLSSHTSCSSPSIRYQSYSSSCYSSNRTSISSIVSNEPRLQWSSPDNRLKFYHPYPIPSTNSDYIQEGDPIWMELLERWCKHEDARADIEEEIDALDLDTNSEPEGGHHFEGVYDKKHKPLLPAYFHLLERKPISTSSRHRLLESIILQQTHTLHLSLALHSIPLIFSASPLSRPSSPESPLSLHRTPSIDSIFDTETTNHPLVTLIHRLTTTLIHLPSLSSLHLTLSLYPGRPGDIGPHCYSKYFDNLEDVEGLWDILAPLKAVPEIEWIVVRRLGATLRWGRRGSSLFPGDGGVCIVEEMGGDGD